jgi:hypothetical protein
MHKNATKCNETLNKWCKNKHGSSKNYGYVGDVSYTGAKDGMRYSEEELDPKVIEKRIRSLMKSPRKKPLKFGMAMFENGSCPPVRCFSAIVHMIPLNFMRANVFSFPIFS